VRQQNSEQPQARTLLGVPFCGENEVVTATLARCMVVNFAKLQDLLREPQPSN
jgi:hypothetical protein